MATIFSIIFVVVFFVVFTKLVKKQSQKSPETEKGEGKYLGNSEVFEGNEAKFVDFTRGETPKPTGYLQKFPEAQYLYFLLSVEGVFDKGPNKGRKSVTVTQVEYRDFFRRFGRSFGSSIKVDIHSSFASKGIQVFESESGKEFFVLIPIEIQYPESWLSDIIPSLGLSTSSAEKWNNLTDEQCSEIKKAQKKQLDNALDSMCWPVLSPFRTQIYS